MAKNIGQLGRDLRNILKGFEDVVDDRMANAVGYTIRQRMLQLIARGISPIFGYGRFPGYKGVSAARKTSAKARAMRSSKSGRKPYPFSVQKQFPAKRPRPVNLFLSGSFLSDLTFAVASLGRKKVIEIGYFEELSAKKESGHREGVNGQPKRPTIPKGNETFSSVIISDILSLFRQGLRSRRRT